MTSQKKLLLSFNSVNNFFGIGNMWGLEINLDYKKGTDLTNLIRSELLQEGLITWECGVKGNVIGLIPPICSKKSSLDLSINILTKILIKF